MTNTQQVQNSNILNDLKNGIVTIDFTKADGSQRIMKATLSSEYVTETEANAADSNYDQVSVFDVEAGQWKSFSPSRLNSYSV